MSIEILRVKFTKESYLRYISHLDLVGVFQRAFNRGKIPVNYSEGFNPIPVFSIGAPLPLGVSSMGEYMDIELRERVDEKKFIELMNKSLPEEIKILDCKYEERRNPLPGLIRYGDYKIQLIVKEDKDILELEKNLLGWYRQDEILIVRTRERKKKLLKYKVDIKKMINSFETERIKKNLIININMETGSFGNVRPRDLIGKLEEDIGLNDYVDHIYVERLDLYIEDINGKIKKPI